MKESIAIKQKEIEAFKKSKEEVTEQLKNVEKRIVELKKKLAEEKQPELVADLKKQIAE